MAAAIVLCGAAAGYPTSLNLVPTADMLEAGSLRVEWERDGYPGLLSGEGDSFLLLQAGLSDRLEAGTDLYHCDGNTTAALNAKWLLAREAGKRPALAVGMLDVGNGMRPVSYVAASGDVGPLRLHGGAARTGNHVTGFGGAEYEVRAGLYLLADYRAGREGYLTIGIYGEGASGAAISLAVGFPNASDGSNLLLVNVSRRFALR